MSADRKRMVIHRSKGQSGGGAAKIPAIGPKVKRGRKRK
jgi:hypothetical protein